MPQRKISSRVANFWKRLAQNYGARLQEQYGPTCPEDWVDVLERLSPEQLNRLLVDVRRDHVKFPPTLGEIEVLLPRRKTGEREPSNAEKLAEYAVRSGLVCEHIGHLTWTYSGPVVSYDKEGRPEHQIQAVTLPLCDVERCPRFGGPRTVRIEELPK